MFLLFLEGYITVWDVGSFLLHPPTENNSEQHQEEDQENTKDEPRKEPKVIRD